MKYVSRGKEFTSKYVLRCQNITLSLQEVDFSAFNIKIIHSLPDDLCHWYLDFCIDHLYCAIVL